MLQKYFYMTVVLMAAHPTLCMDNSRVTHRRGYISHEDIAPAQNQVPSAVVVHESSHQPRQRANERSCPWYFTWAGWKKTIEAVAQAHNPKEESAADPILAPSPVLPALGVSHIPIAVNESITPVVNIQPAVNNPQATADNSIHTNLPAPAAPAVPESPAPATDAEYTPKMKLVDMAGTPHEKILMIIEKLKNPEKYSNNGSEVDKGLLLYGPPGTGKSSYAEIIATESKRLFIRKSSSDLVTSYQASGAQGVRAIFETALTTNKPCVICIEELDGVSNENTNGSCPEYRQATYAIFEQLDKKHPQIFFIGTTNHQGSFPSALMSRFGTNIVKIDLPNREERKAIINHHIRNKNFSSMDSFMPLLLKNTEKFSGRDLKTVINEARDLATYAASDQVLERHVFKAYCSLGNITLNKERRACMLYNELLGKTQLNYEFFQELGEEIKGATFENMKTIVTKTLAVASQYNRADAILEDDLWVALYITLDTLTPDREIQTLIVKYYLAELGYALDKKLIDIVVKQTLQLSSKSIKALLEKARKISLAQRKSAIDADDIAIALTTKKVDANATPEERSKFIRYYFLKHGLQIDNKILAMLTEIVAPFDIIGLKYLIQLFISESKIAGTQIITKEVAYPTLVRLIKTGYTRVIKPGKAELHKNVVTCLRQWCMASANQLRQKQLREQAEEEYYFGSY